MRKTKLGMIFGLAALSAAAGVPTAAAADASPVSTQPLAANEVLLEVSALGTGISRADLATISGTLASRGATEVEARRERDAQIRRLTAAARRAGVAAADLMIGEAESIAEASTMDMSMEMPAADAAEAAMNAAEDAVAETADAAVEDASCNACSVPAEPEVVLSSGVEVRLRNLDKVAELTQALQEAGVEIYAEPVYAPGDQSAARRTARAEALAAARADADAYAASLGMRVVRVVRVTERMGLELISLLVNNSSLLTSMLQPHPAQGPDIPTFVTVGVDFALAPQ